MASASALHRFTPDLLVPEFMIGSGLVPRGELLEMSANMYAVLRKPLNLNDLIKMFSHAVY